MKRFLTFFSGLSAWLLAGQVKAAGNLSTAFNETLNTTASGMGLNTSQRTIEPIIANIITVVLSFLGVIFMALVIYAGVTWMTAAGNDSKIKKAKEFMSAAVIGLIIVIAAYAITYMVMIRFASNLLAQ